MTVADKAVEDWLASKLLELQPGGLIGEEAVSNDTSLMKGANQGYAWTIDPIDGTNNFVKGVKNFCSMVALIWNGIPIQCWIWLPCNQTLYYAAAGKGAFCYQNSEAKSLCIGDHSLDPLKMSGSSNVKGLSEPNKSVVLNRMRTMPGRQYIGSAGVLATRIAEGKDDFLIHGCSTPWDHSPVDLLCREAGGYSAMVNDAGRFHVSEKGPIMVTASAASWRCLYDYIWCNE